LAVLTCVALAASALPVPWPAVAAVWGAVGIGSAVQLPASATFMLTVPDALRARGFGLAQTGLMGGQALALLLAGAVAGAAGTATPLLVLAVLGLGGVTLLALGWPLRTTPAPAPRAALTRALRRRRAAPRLSAVDAWIGAVVVASSVSVSLALQERVVRAAPWHPPLVVLAVLFFATGSYVATTRIGRQAHVLQLDAVPKLLGLFFVSPATLMAARLLGVAVALVGVRGQRGRKLVFNVASCGLETSVAIAVFHALDPGGVGPPTWIAAAAATLSADLVSAWTVGVVIGLAEGRLRLLRVLRPDRLAMGTALGATTVGVIAVTTLWHSPSSLALLAVLVGLAALGQRAFIRLEAERLEQERLQDLLGQLSELEPGPDSTARALTAVRALLEVEAVGWCQPGADGGWATAQEEGADLDGELLRLLTQGLHAHGGATGPVVHVEPGARTGWRSHTGPAHVAVLLPTQRRTGSADPYPGDVDLADPGPCVLVASRPLHDSRADAGLVRLVQTAAELLGQAATRVEHREQLLLAARQDALTGLSTLPEFRRRLQTQLDGGAQLAVLMLNLRRLRSVNEVFGRDGGDRVIAAAAHRAATLLPDGLLGRVGGHHLACAVPLTTTDSAVEVGRWLRTALESPLPTGTVDTEIGVHVGIALSTLHGGDVDLLLRRAETAADSAEQEPAGVAVFDPDHEQDVARSLRLVSDLRTALRTGDQLQLVFQPQIDLRSDRVVGAEALLRWQHPELGTVSPEEFVGLAESTGLIAPLLDWTLDAALAQSARWQHEGLPAKVAVNLSPLNLLDDGLVPRVREALARHAVVPGQLVLEVTETSFLAQPLRSALLLEGLRDLGVGLSVDDFGTGYSNLTYLRELPVSEVKLDRTFVQAPVGDDAAGSRDRLRDFLGHAVGLVHALGLHVVVEGIEDQETLELLRDLGADSGQGYHVCRPLPGPACTLWLRERVARVQGARG
ncbi:MAG: putative Diguanylate cyclase/phosphodiesterase, partial [Frankiales bacterium]|nr:putative Diguanylate cyclase/phosphodiesterase [Frankiales bacterium]